MNTKTRIRWSGVAFALALSAGCATDTKQAAPTSEEPPAPVVEESTPEARPTSEAYALPGFAVYEVDGRLWVFRDGSVGRQQFLEHGEPARNATLVGEGPEGKTLKGAEIEALKAYREAWRAR
jgi:hypothetical protein